MPESLQARNFIKKESLAQVFSCEFCEISKNNFFYRTPPAAASESRHLRTYEVQKFLYNVLMIKDIFLRIELKLYDMDRFIKLREIDGLVNFAILIDS